MNAAAAARPHPVLRNTLFALLGLLGLVVLAVVVCEFIEWPFLRHPLERKLSAALARPVAIGPDFGVRLLGSVRGHTDDLAIGPGAPGMPTLVDDAGRPRDFLHASHVRLALSYAAIWSQWKGTGAPLQVRLLDVDGLELNLKRDAGGHANWQLAAASAPGPASAPRLPRFELLDVRNGEVRLVDEPLQVVADAHVRTHEGSAQANAAPASAFAPASGGAAPGLAIGINAPAPHARVSALSAASAASAASAPFPDADAPGLEVVGTGSYHRQPLALQFRSSGLLPLASSDEAAPPVPLWLDLRAGKTQIRVDGRGTDVLHFGGLDATYRASGPSLAAVGDALGVTLPTTAEFSTRGTLRKRADVWEAGVSALDIGSSRLRGDFRFDTGPDVPVLSGRLRGTRLAIVDLGPAFGGGTEDQPKATKTGHVLPAREFDIPSLHAMEADVGIDLDAVDLGTSRLEPFEPLRGHLTLKDGVLRLTDILARTSQGQVQGAIGLDSRPAVPRWDAELRWAGIRLERFVKARDVAARPGKNGEPPNPVYISGGLGGSAKLRGAGKSTAALLGSLDGNVELWVRDGTVSHILIEAAGIDIAQALGVYIKGDDPLPMRCAVSSLLVAKGKVMPEVAVLDTHDTTLLAEGDLSLADETLALKMTAHPHDFSPVALRAPVRIDGTFDAPHVHLEGKPIAERAGAAAALAAVNPLASLLALLDFKQPEKDVCTTAVAHVAGAARAGVVASAPQGAPQDTSVARTADQAQAQARAVRGGRPASAAHP
jgi:uncharacterized protein involved in outer membrane biogenesis